MQLPSQWSRALEAGTIKRSSTFFADQKSWSRSQTLQQVTYKWLPLDLAGIKQNAATWSWNVDFLWVKVELEPFILDPFIFAVHRLILWSALRRALIAWFNFYPSCKRFYMGHISDYPLQLHLPLPFLYLWVFFLLLAWKYSTKQQSVQWEVYIQCQNY